MQQKPEPISPHSDQNQVATEGHFISPEALSLPSCGELERSIGQAVQKAYRQYLGHLPTRVSCHLFANRLSVWIENSLTPVENILFLSDAVAAPVTSTVLASSQSSQSIEPISNTFDEKYAQTVRFAIDRALQQRLGKVIESCLDVSVLTLIAGTCYKQKCTSLTALLSNTPTVRNPERIPKTAASRQANRKVVIKEQADNPQA